MASSSAKEPSECGDIAAQSEKGVSVAIVLMSDTRVGSAEFGDYHYQRFLAWSFSDRQSKAALLRNLAAARTDANQDLIDRKLDFYCKLYGISEDALMERILQADGGGISIAKLHQALAKEAGLDPKNTPGAGEKTASEDY